MNKEDYINISKPEFLDMPKYLKKILNGTDEPQYIEVMLQWVEDLPAGHIFDIDLLKIALKTKLPLDYVNAMKEYPDGN